MKRRFRCLWCGKVFTEPDEVFGYRRRSSHRFREYPGREALHQTVRKTAEKEKVGEGLVRSKLQGGNRRGKRLADWEKGRLNQLFYRYPELRKASGHGIGKQVGVELRQGLGY